MLRPWGQMLCVISRFVSLVFLLRFEFSLSVRVKRIHLDSSLAQQSGQAIVSPVHLFGASDGGEHFLLVSEQGSSDLVQLGDVVHDGEDVTLASGVSRLQTDASGLASVVVAGGLLVDALLVAQGGGGGIFFGGQLGLGLLQLVLEIGLLLGALLLQSVEFLLSLIASSCRSRRRR